MGFASPFPSRPPLCARCGSRLSLPPRPGVVAPPLCGPCASLLLRWLSAGPCAGWWARVVRRWLARGSPRA